MARRIMTPALGWPLLLAAALLLGGCDDAATPLLGGSGDEPVTLTMADSLSGGSIASARPLASLYPDGEDGATAFSVPSPF